MKSTGSDWTFEPKTSCAINTYSSPWSTDISVVEGHHIRIIGSDSPRSLS